MEIIKSVSLLLSFCGYLSLVNKKCRLISWFVPLPVVCGISLVMYLGGLVGTLEMTAYIVLLGGLFCFAYVVKMAAGKKISFHPPGTPMLCFLAGSSVFLLVVFYQNLLHYDNFSHWALIVKYLLGTGHYPDASDTLIVFKDYPPGTAVFLYYICTFAGKGEGVMLAAQTGIILSCFSAVFGIIRESRRFFLYSFLSMGCCMLSYLNLTIRINNLLVDFLLPLLVLSAAAAAYRYRTQPAKASLCTGVVLGFSGIIKNTGIIFAVIGFLYYLGKTLSLGTVRFRHRAGWCVLTGTLSCIPYLLWKLYVSHAFAGEEFKFSLTGTSQDYMAADPDFYGQIIRDFIRAAVDPSGRAVQVFVLCNILAVAAMWFARVYLKKKWRLGMPLFLSNSIIMVYYGGILGLYLFAMPQEEAVRLAGFERYACSIMVLFAGSLILCTAVEMEGSFAVDIDESGAYRAYSSPEAKRRYQYAVLASMVLALNFLYSEANGLWSIQKEHGQSLPGRVKKITGDRWYEDGEVDKNRYLVAAADSGGQVSDWSVWYVCRYYLFAPEVDVIREVNVKNITDIQDNFDYVIVLDEEAVKLQPDDPGYEILRKPGLYKADW